MHIHGAGTEKEGQAEKVMVRAKIIVCERGTVIKIQREKYKHWFAFGTHRETDISFLGAMKSGRVDWDCDIINVGKLF